MLLFYLCLKRLNKKKTFLSDPVKFSFPIQHALFKRQSDSSAKRPPNDPFGGTGLANEGRCEGAVHTCRCQAVPSGARRFQAVLDGAKRCQMVPDGAGNVERALTTC